MAGVEFGRVTTWKQTFGFIRPMGDTREGEVFVHFSQIRAAGFRALHAGQRVTFVRGVDDRGRERAIDVEVMDD